MTVQSAMIYSIPAEIAESVMEPRFINNPAALVEAVIRHIGMPSEADHRALEGEADSIRLRMCDYFDDYLAKTLISDNACYMPDSLP